MTSQRASAIIPPNHLTGSTGGWCSREAELRVNPAGTAKGSSRTWVDRAPWAPAVLGACRRLPTPLRPLLCHSVSSPQMKCFALYQPVSHRQGWEQTQDSCSFAGAVCWRSHSFQVSGQLHLWFLTTFNGVLGHRKMMGSKGWEIK